MPDGKANLIPISQMSRDRHIQMSRNGGRSTSPRKSEGAKFRHLKDRMRRDGAKDDDIKYFLERIENRELALADAIKTLEAMQNNIHPAQRIAWMNTLLSALKLLHGERIKTENVNVNVSATIEEWERRLLD